MSKRVRRRRGTSTQHDEFTGADGEITVNTSDYRLHAHDGSTAGGVPTAREDEVADLSGVSDASTARSNLGGVPTTGGGNFPNVDADVTATDEEMNAVLTPYETATVELGGDFDAGEEVKCERIGNTVTITGVGGLGHSSSSSPGSSNAIPSNFRPSTLLEMVYSTDSLTVREIEVSATGTITTRYRDWSGSATSRTNTQVPPSITYIIT